MIFDEFDIIPADVDENVGEDIPVHLRPELIAEKKAAAVAEKHTDCLVIGCDTAVIAGSLMLGKPKDKADAEKMLRLLSGKAHEVITGCCVITGSRKLSFSVSTEVVFYELSDEEIAVYTEGDEWADKAGAYGIQDEGALLIDSISGDYYAVVGLPVSRVNRELQSLL